MLAWTLRSIALLAIWLLLFGFGLSSLQEHRHQSVAYATIRNDLAQATVPISAPIDLGAPIAVIDAPSVGMHNLVVSEGTSSDELRNGPGHRTDTVLPGDIGTSVLFGKSQTFGGPFSGLNRLQRGAKIVVTDGAGTFTYVVDRQRRPGDPLPALPVAGTSRLVLETSQGATWLGGLASSHILYVDATLHGTPVPAGPVGAAQAAGTSMTADTGGLSALVLWLQGLVVVALGSVWLARRWGRWQTWLAAGPLLLLFLWGATGSAALLLPNLV